MALWTVRRYGHLVFVILQPGLFELLRYYDHLVENVLVYWPNYETNIVNKTPLHEAYIVAFVEQPRSNSLDTCEEKWYHQLDALVNIQNIILPRMKYFLILLRCSLTCWPFSPPSVPAILLTVVTAFSIWF